jgi:hypothetical protein
VSASTLLLAAAIWFGPVQVVFDASFDGNPYDPAVNDVRVVFTNGEGVREERLAYFDDGRWKAWLTATRPGEYSATLLRNGEPVDTPVVPVALPASARLAEGFVRRACPTTSPAWVRPA